MTESEDMATALWHKSQDEARARTKHEPSMVLELPSRPLFCLKCSRPWPCPDSQEENT